ncbi:hypothetical protein [Paraburkholderia sediminicola]|uniref:hypothetical protein n=1 Tax=Paraburkholderia sediminicola TaxID=458836 RepID=UPI0038B9598D
MRRTTRAGALGAAVMKWGAAGQLTAIAILPVLFATLITWLQSRAQAKPASA